METPIHQSGFRPEIQGLRAVAVVLVLIFHLWPAVLSGGYVGVDVFFVISGFLITGLLLRQAETRGTISIIDFYAKRIKRLLPAATIVLLGIAICISLLPIVRWADTANEIAASALYVENWWLAGKAVDYLAADNAPSPLQHFWSLSVEEQYYIIWPLIFAAATRLGFGLKWSPRRFFGALIAVIGLSSLAYSVFLTPRDPGVAYFATTTRAWELALGGALATFSAWEKLPDLIRRGLGLLGLLMVLAAATFYSESTPFPGYQALLPTLGAAFLIISGGAVGTGSVYPLLRSRPFQYVGDLSYSLYLWHWPVVIFYREISGRDLGLVDGVVVAAVSLALAHQTKVVIEDRFRAPACFSGGKWMPFAFAAGCIVSVLLCWGIITYQVSRHAEVASDQSAEAALAYPGAMALSDGLAVPPVDSYIPSLLRAVDDKGDPYKDGCIAGLLDTEVRECKYGAAEGDLSIVLVGDSHAVHWVPTIQVIADNAGAKFTAITKSACAVAELPGEKPSLEQYRTCLEWSQDVITSLLASDADVVIFAHSRNSLSKIRPDRDESAAVIARGIANVWEQLEKQGKVVFAIADTPSFPSEIPGCLASSGATIEQCARDRRRALPQVDPLVEATKLHPSTRLVDMTDSICGPERCDPVVGNIIAWRDAHHMTATFARTLAPALSRQLSPVVPEVKVAVADTAAAARASKSLPLRPALAVARKDVPSAYAEGCHLDQVTEEPRACSFGDPESGTTLFVIGDSHAAQWLPAYEKVATSKGWYIRSFTKSACAFADIEVVGGRSGGVYESCKAWNDNMLELVAVEQPDYILVSQSRAYKTIGAPSSEESNGEMVSALQRQWSKASVRGGSALLVLADTPRIGIDVPECLSKEDSSIASCSRSAEPILARPDPLAIAAEEFGAPLITMNDVICTGEVCPPVAGDVLIWRDSHHVSATFASEVSGHLLRKLELAMGSAESSEGAH